MKLQTIIDHLHSIAPNAYQESYDNSGLLVGSYEAEVKAVLVSLDVTEAILDEAMERGCNVVISHHPIIFSGLKRLVGADYVQRIVQKAIKNDINLFAIHTNLDNVYESGVNTYIAKRLGLKEVQILKQKEGFELDQRVGAGIIGEITPTIEDYFLEIVKEKMAVGCIKHTALLGKPISKVAICGGSGRFLLSEAIRQGADVFISSDFKYHEYFDADGQIVIMDIGHYESEQYTTELLGGLLTEKFSNFAVHLTRMNTNPVSYF